MARFIDFLFDPVPLVRNTGRCILLGGALVLASCATVPADEEAQKEAAAINDPLEPMNRAVFEFNRAFDTALLRPLAEGYRAVLPEAGRNMVRDFLDNLRAPLVFTNDVLQGEPERAGETMGRFAINTVAGLGGLFDVSGIDHHGEDFGQTLAVWGAPEGPYLVLPFFGPSPVRDTVGLVGDFYLDPINHYLDNADRTNLRWVRLGARAIDTRSRNIETLDEIERSAIDLYATVRSLYRQRRNDEIRNGNPAPTVPMPEISFDLDDDEYTGKLTFLKSE